MEGGKYITDKSLFSSEGSCPIPPAHFSKEGQKLASPTTMHTCCRMGSGWTRGRKSGMGVNSLSLSPPQISIFCISHFVRCPLKNLGFLPSPPRVLTAAPESFGVRVWEWAVFGTWWTRKTTPGNANHKGRSNSSEKM